jgi:phosphoribosyl 1,2-cyclic phosphodiesterase
MTIKIWGARGWTSTPERRNSRYGGNTPCVEVRLANGTRIVLDCGTGLRPLGNSLHREFGERPILGFVFLTHFPWDHIQKGRIDESPDHRRCRVYRQPFG